MNKIFYVYWLLMPFYIFPSGQMQIAHMVLSVGFVLFFFSKIAKNKSLITQIDTKLFLFVMCVFLINILYFLFIRQVWFLLSSMFYLFNLFLVVIFRSLSGDMKFIKTLFYLCRLNLFVQMFIYIIGLGGDFGGRHIGTLNDPNQFAFFVFSTFLIMYVVSISKKFSVKLRVFDYAITIFLIVMSASVGVFLGVATLVIAIILINVPKRLMIPTIAAIATCIALVFLIFDIHPDDIFLLDRLDQRVFDNTLVGFFEDRALERVYQYPQFLLFGSGEGAHGRFTPTGAEMHSTLLSIFFYYGIIPFLILIFWLKSNLRNMDKRYLPVILAILIESFVLLNQRQPFIWVIVVLIHSLSDNENTTIAAKITKNSIIVSNLPKKVLAWVTKQPL